MATEELKGRHFGEQMEIWVFRIIKNRLKKGKSIQLA